MGSRTHTSRIDTRSTSPAYCIERSNLLTTFHNTKFTQRIDGAYKTRIHCQTSKVRQQHTKHATTTQPDETRLHAAHHKQAEKRQKEKNQANVMITDNRQTQKTRRDSKEEKKKHTRDHTTKYTDIAVQRRLNACMRQKKHRKKGA